MLRLMHGGASELEIAPVGAQRSVLCWVSVLLSRVEHPLPHADKPEGKLNSWILSIFQNLDLIPGQCSAGKITEKQ